MAATLVKIKNFESTLLTPLATPDGSSLEELVNSFLATLSSSNVLDVVKESHSTGKYGITQTHFATVVYRA